MNVSLEGEDIHECYTPKFFCFILIFFGLFILAENILMIYTISQTPILQTNANVFVVSLGVNDLLIGITIICFGIFSLAWGALWPAEVMYPLTGGCSLGLTTGSFLHMGIIAVDRHTYIAHPYTYLRKCTKGVICKVVAAVWLATLVLSFLPALLQESDYSACVISSMPRLYKVYISAPLTYLALLITCVAYLKIALLSNNQRRAIAAAMSALGHNSGGLGQKEAKRLGLIKSVRFFVVMFGFFFIFSVPAMICITIRQYHDFSESIFSAILLLVPLNSMTNFFINYAMNRDFKAACKKVLRNLCSHIMCQLKYLS